MVDASIYPFFCFTSKTSFAAAATVLDNTRRLIGREPNGIETTPFDYGSGHINPTAALKPGLIYDFDSSDIINFLCSTGANPGQLKNLTGHLTYCQNTPLPSYNLNYPSIGVSNMNGSLSVHRTVTYYGRGQTVYAAYICCIQLVLKLQLHLQNFALQRL